MFNNNNNLGPDISSLFQKRQNPFLTVGREELIKGLDRIKQMLDALNIIVLERKKIRDVSELNYQEEYGKLEEALRNGKITVNDKDYLVMFKKSLDQAENEFCHALEQKFQFETIFNQMEEALNAKMNSSSNGSVRN